jgi:hypothetical protein
MRILFLLAALLLQLSTFAQKKKSKAPDKASSFSTSAGLSFTTTGVYDIAGADTSIVNRLALSPFAELRHDSGFGVIYHPVIVIGGDHKGLLMHNITASFERYDLPNWSVDIAYTHTFFTRNSNFPSSPLNNEFYAMGSYTKPWLAPTLSAAYGFGKDSTGSASDLSVSAGVGHNFSGKNKARKTEWSISPSLSVNGATNNNYSYLENTKYISRNGKLGKALGQKHANKRHNGQGNTTTTAGTESTASVGFAVNNIEAGFWSSYSKGHFEVNPMGSIYFPLVSGNSVSAYWQLSFRYNF